jgi:glycosyltransferase involved in cell wall biosynthesis
MNDSYSCRIRLGIYDLGSEGGSTRYLKDLLSGLPTDEYEIVFFPPEAAATYCFAASDTNKKRRGEPPRPTTDSGRAAWPSPPHRIPSQEPSPVTWLARLWHCLPQSLRLAVGLVRETIALARQIRAAHVDVFHSNYTGFEIAPIAARLAGIKNVIGIYHNLPSEGFITHRWVQLFFENLSGWCLTTPVAVSKATAKEWEARCRTLRGRFRVIYTGVDIAAIQQAATPPVTRAALGIAEDAPILLVAARLHPMKGINYLLDAMPAILEKHPQTILLLAGDGNERERLQTQADALGVTGHVRFLGWRDDVPRLLTLADTVVQPSVNLETFGYTLVEAMALGKPCVATAVGGMPEVVEDGVTGLIVPKRDVAALTRAIVELLDDPARARQFGQNGRKRVQDLFRLETMIQQTQALYQERGRAAA